MRRGGKTDIMILYPTETYKIHGRRKRGPEEDMTMESNQMFHVTMGQTARDFDTCREQVRSEVDALCRKFPIYQ